jgi:peptidoglycan/LPS O-acetylase OafA/YrhL
MNRRLVELDSLRGLAAITVLFSHFSLVLDQLFIEQKKMDIGFYLYKYTPIHIVWSGHEAVIFFFVLSGFVLTLPFLKEGQHSYQNYLVKRLFRIYLPCLFSVFLALFLKLSISNDTNSISSEWIAGMWNNPTSLIEFLKHIVLITNFDPELNPVLWSLIHEIRISIIFPSLVFLVIRHDWKNVLIFGFSLSVLGVLIEKILGISSVTTNYFISLHYVFMFLVGSLLAKKHHEITNSISRLKLYNKLILLLVGLISYTFRWLFSSNELLHNKLSNEWATTLGACIFIVLALSSIRISKVLRTKPIIYIGQISYSFYLYHIIILLFLTKKLGNLPLSLIYSFTIIATLLVASISYYFIEKPSIVLGRKVSNKIVQKQRKIA